MDAASVVQTLLLSVTIAGLYGAVASGLTLEFGVTHIINFAHGEFVMLGAFITYLLYVHWQVPVPAAMLVAGVVMAAFSWIIFTTFLMRVLRTNEHNQLLATMGLSILLVNLALIVWGGDPHTLNVPDIVPALHLGTVTVPGNNLFTLGCAILLYAAITLFVRYTRYGVQMRFASADPQLAELTGVNVERMFAMSFVIGGFAAGFAGGLVALVLYVYPMVSSDLIIRAFAIIALGGMGSIPGALIGAVFLSLAESAISTFIPGGASWGYGIAFVILVLVLVIRPNGLLGEKLRA